MPDIVPSSPHKDFESIKKIDGHGIEYWSARDLMAILGYKRWAGFLKVVQKAQTAARKSSQNVSSHFVPHPEGSDFKLSRYACYLIVQNGDPGRPAVANAQTYFAIQARRHELGYFAANSQRLLIRQEVKRENKELFKTAAGAGVTDFGTFNRMGYLGLYGMTIDQAKSRKNIGDDDLLDRAGAAELAANLFRITQTGEKIKNEKITGQGRASLTHLSVGKKIRQTLKDISGTLPEDLPAQPHIKQLTKRLKSRRNFPKLLK